MNETKRMFEDLFQLMRMGTGIDWTSPNAKECMEACVGQYILRHASPLALAMARAVAVDVETSGSGAVFRDKTVVEQYISDRSGILVWWNKLISAYEEMPQTNPVEVVAARSFLYNSMRNVVQKYAPYSPPPIQMGMMAAVSMLG